MLTVDAYSGEQQVLSSGSLITSSDKPAILELKDKEKFIHKVELIFNVVERGESNKGLSVDKTSESQNTLVLTIPQGDTVTMTSTKPITEYNGHGILASFRVEAPSVGKIILTYTFLKGGKIADSGTLNKRKSNG